MSLLRPEFAKKLSPEGRTKNSYEALYYRVNSGDPETDEVLRREIQNSFREYDITLADGPNKDILRIVMLQAYKNTAKEIQGEDLTPEQIETIEQNFDSLVDNHTKFYDTVFDSYERKYEGETVDFSADYERYLKEINADFSADYERYSEEIDGVQYQYDDVTLDNMQKEYDAKYEPESERSWDEIQADVDTVPFENKTGSSLSYAGHVPEAKVHTAKRSYAQIKQEEKAAEELKGSDFDKKYDAYARNRQDNHSKFTAGDDYGFDEREDELEDDGPEL